MKINIYGTGRSGTKVLQLYIAYLIALKEGKIWINFEPYYWLNRKVNRFSYKGIYWNYREPLLLSNLSEGHKKFIRSLLPNGTSAVTKFIRANGRIDGIEAISKPDFSYLVVRNLKGVLASLQRLGWSLYTDEKIPMKPKIWDKVRMEFDLDNFDKQLNNREKTSYFWYLMNKAALMSKASTHGNLYVIDYGELDKWSEQIMQMIGVESNIKINQIRGNWIYSNKLICSEEQSSTKVDSFNYNLMKWGLLSKGIYIKEGKIGSGGYIVNPNKILELEDEEKRINKNIENNIKLSERELGWENEILDLLNNKKQVYS